MIGLVVGITVGWLIGQLDIRSPDHHILGVDTQTILGFVRSLSTLFLNLIKSIIAPLIFATLVVGISGTGDIKQVGRIGAKSLLYFEVVTTLALVIGLAAVNITRPGDGVSLAGVVKGDDKATLALKAQTLSKESTDAAKRAAELRAQAAQDPGALTAADEQTALAAEKAAAAADAAAKGLDGTRPAGKTADLWRDRSRICRRHRS